MNTQLKFLPILIIAATVTVTLQPASAKGARFDFAPNIFPLEHAQLPAGYGEPPVAPHSVQTGSVPKSSSFLGVDPQLLSKAPVAPLARAIPSMNFTKAVPLNSPYQSTFGKPVTPSQPVMATLPKAAAPLALNPPATKPVAAKNASKSVSGKLLNKPKHVVVPSRATALALGKKIDSYGQNSGYTPGGYLPTASGSGMTINADVSGKLLQTHMGR
jgi:hypothetical protein